MSKDFVVKAFRGELVFGQFDTYSDAFALWREIVKHHPTAVIQDNSK